jgi:hypothetical protein
VSKRTVILLIVVLVSAIVFAGHAEANAVVKQSPTSVNVPAPFSVSGSLHYGTSDGNRLPTVPHTMIFDFLYDYTPQACWMQSTRYRGQIYGFARTGHVGIGIALGASHSCGFVQHDQSNSTIPMSSSESLSSLSPPGLILRL